VSFLTRGFRGRARGDIPAGRIPPGQYVTDDFPVLTAGPTPRLPLEENWRFGLTDLDGAERTWTWEEFNALPREKVTADIHCVTKWSKLNTTWEGVSVDTLLTGIPDRGSHVLFRSYGNYSTNLPIDTSREGRRGSYSDTTAKPSPWNMEVRHACSSLTFTSGRAPSG